MYNISYVTGNNADIGSALKLTIDNINKSGGTIVHLVQSQSTSPSGFTNVTVTIIYQYGPKM